MFIFWYIKRYVLKELPDLIDAVKTIGFCITFYNITRLCTPITWHRMDMPFWPNKKYICCFYCILKILLLYVKESTLFFISKQEPVLAIKVFYINNLRLLSSMFPKALPLRYLLCTIVSENPVQIIRTIDRKHFKLSIRYKISIFSTSNKNLVRRNNCLVVKN